MVGFWDGMSELVEKVWVGSGSLCGPGLGIVKIL